MGDLNNSAGVLMTSFRNLTMELNDAFVIAFGN